MGRIESSIEIEAPVEKVFTFFADPKSMEKMIPEDAEVKVEMISKGPIGVGTTWRISGVLGGRKIESESECVEFEENRRMTTRQTKGDFKRFDGTIVFEATEKGTKVTDTMDYELPYSVVGKIMDKLKAGKDLERFAKEGYEKAKQILEEG
ncbi:MAG: SRPBCC family protein [Candidatus Methanofastidiosia archaeon]